MTILLLTLCIPALTMADYNIDEDWIFQLSPKYVPGLSGSEKTSCEQSCMNKHCSKYTASEVATLCMQNRCPTPLECGCVWETFSTVADITAHYRPCLQQTQWWKKFQQRKQTFRTKCGIAMDSFFFQKQHCFHNFGDIVYAGGDVDWTANVENGWTAKAKRVVLHPSRDIAIVELNRQIENTAPVCLPPKDQQLPPPDFTPNRPGWPYRVAGWGRTASTANPSKLTYTDLRWHYDAWNNKSSYPSLNAICNKDVATVLCSREGYEGKTSSTCRGDSGTGWLYVTKDKDNLMRWHVMGTLMGGNGYLCEKDKVPPYKVWVNVIKELDWICEETGIGC